jgi:hypothetical protein
MSTGAGSSPTTGPSNPVGTNNPGVGLGAGQGMGVGPTGPPMQQQFQNPYAPQPLQPWLGGQQFLQGLQQGQPVQGQTGPPMQPQPQPGFAFSQSQMQGQPVQGQTGPPSPSWLGGQQFLQGLQQQGLPNPYAGQPQMQGQAMHGGLGSFMPHGPLTRSD